MNCLLKDSLLSIGDKGMHNRYNPVGDIPVTLIEFKSYKCR